jgi:hypothetical protein
VKSITEHFRLWQMNLLRPLNLQVGDTETCRLSWSGILEVLNNVIKNEMMILWSREAVG